MKTLILTTARSGLLGLMGVFALLLAPQAWADTMLLATTNLVSGSTADTFSFEAPSPGTVTVQLSNLAWPVPLSALSFSATTATSVLDSWSAPGAAGSGEMESFQVGSGTYFAHVMATAGGSLDLGLYSLMLTFTPSAVPLSASSWMLLTGLLVLFGLIRTLRNPGPHDGFERPASTAG